MEKWNIQFMSSKNSLSIIDEKILNSISNVYYRASDVFSGTKSIFFQTKIDFKIEIESDGVIPEIGISGSCPQPGLILLTIDPNNKTLGKSLGNPLERMIAHELHHALRRETVGYGKTLLEALVSEGLAGHFSQELYGNDPEPWESALSNRNLRNIAKLALSEADSYKYDHQTWFFGDGYLPKWSGYTLGWKITQDLPGELNGLKYSQFISVPASMFRGSLFKLTVARRKAFNSKRMWISFLGSRAKKRK